MASLFIFSYEVLCSYLKSNWKKINEISEAICLIRGMMKYIGVLQVKLPNLEHVLIKREQIQNRLVS